MSWNYNLEDTLPAATVPEPAAPTFGAQDLDDREVLNREASQLSAQIPAEFATLLNRPDLSPDDKLALVRELVQLSQEPQLNAQDIATASPAIREAALAIKERRDAIAEQEQQLAGMVLTPVAALAAPAVAPAPAPREATLAEALQYVFDKGPDHTPGMGAGRDMGQGLG